MLYVINSVCIQFWSQVLRFYIADDSRGFAEFCATVAERDGWRVTICRDGEELARQLNVEDGPALVFVDIQMPILDGIEVIEKMKSMRRKLRLRFVTGGPASSALAARMIADARGLDTGRFLTKPLGLSTLRDVLVEEAQCLCR